jgi:hypothetical protein
MMNNRKKAEQIEFRNEYNKDGCFGLLLILFSIFSLSMLGAFIFLLKWLVNNGY